jgi:hypothetical protein
LALFAIYPSLYSIFNVSQEQASGVGFGFISNQYPDALVDFIYSNNYFLLVALGFSIILFIITKLIKEAKQFNEIKTFLILSGYFLFFEWLYTLGHNPIANAIGPDRTFFAFSLILAGLIASFYQALGKDFSLKISKLIKAKTKEKISIYFRVMLIIILGFSLFQISFVKDYLNEHKGDSSLLPKEINETLVYNNQEIPQKILPPWFDTKENNFRFYEINNNLNIWWNIIFDLPIVKGYFPVMPSQNAVNWLYWADQTFIGEIVEHFNTPVPVAKNSALFLIDWYGVKYLDNQAEPLDIANYLMEENGFVKNKVEEERLKFIEVNDDFTSPIIRSLNSPTLLVIANDSSYDNILRILGMENINSRYLIPIHGSEYLDGIKKDELENFDAILLYNYQYKNRKVWDLLEEYVKGGGNLIIETGSEVKESDLKNTKEVSELPNVFPIEKTTRQELGREWNFQKSEGKILTDITLDNFSPLIFEDMAWKLSYAEKQDVKSWGNIILSQKDKPVLVEGNLGQGRVIWSGMNLPYHVQTYQNFEESKLFRNLLEETLNLSKDNVQDFQVERLKPERIKVVGKDFSGILFKENAYQGWKALADAKNLKIYKAGLDFIYVRVPDNINEVELNFVGSTAGWALFILSILTFIFIIIFIIFDGKIFKKVIPSFGLSKKVKKWWEKEDEEE